MCERRPEGEVSAAVSAVDGTLDASVSVHRRRAGQRRRTRVLTVGAGVVSMLLLLLLVVMRTGERKGRLGGGRPGKGAAVVRRTCGEDRGLVGRREARRRAVGGVRERRGAW